MRIPKIALNAVLILAILMTGLPDFFPEDLNRDGDVSLQDVILSLKELTLTLNEAEPFGSKFRNTLSTLFTVAGLKPSVISKSDDKKISSFTSLYIVSCFLSLDLDTSYTKAPDVFTRRFISNDSFPPYRPPKSV